mmetsp:Transcript_21529/g.47227  ORF Transcript_21529/g.47227 Transcript_21529/m.47227 type:complete len:395 (-) Transcript_21529:329-1513(-)|eukprot:CAMPEP_0118924178 /NCGR_PEP_ID=MMETSP1169-20130426/2432_1 /TAXON_ID=36882 /ORGANISM="Pyramimonas obovata, Strain CCMP722" /LENGTH=394 /DNA_ID=CAMNT_0006865267 /DNA_START=146 /DNA_END=1330 /DNA_ORIENTATION=+
MAGVEAGRREQQLYHLKNLHVKTILKESHCSPVQQLVFNTIDEDKENLFATVGGNQATIYDDQHFGKYVDVVAQFVNEATEYAKGGELLTCCWLSSKETKEEFGDALLAVAGRDNCVSVISVVSSRVIALLKGHTKPVVDLCACAAKPGLVASVSKDGTVRVWDYLQERCVRVLEADATCAAFRPDGSGLVTGNSAGQLHFWALPADPPADGKRKRASAEGCPAAHVKKSEGAAVLKGASKESAHSAAIDCIRHLAGGRLATKSVDGKLFLWNAASMERQLALKVPGCPPGQQPSLFGASPSGAFLAAGNANGDLYVYDTDSGERLCHCKPGRVSAPVRAAAINEECTHLLAVYGQGFVWRYEFIPPQEEKEVEVKEEAAAEEGESKDKMEEDA